MEQWWAVMEEAGLAENGRLVLPGAQPHLSPKERESRRQFRREVLKKLPTPVAGSREFDCGCEGTGWIMSNRARRRLLSSAPKGNDTTEARPCSKHLPETFKAWQEGTYES